MSLPKGQVVLITGAGRGLGWGIAKAFASTGAKVCATDVNLDELQMGTKEISNCGGTVTSCHLDVADAKEFNQVVTNIVNKWGRLDVLVHTAAVMPLISFENTSYESWWWELNISLGGLFNGAKASWEIMKSQGRGHIIGVASGASYRGHINEIAYCVGKHGQEGFIKSLASEAGNHNIAVNTISPGKSIKPTGITRQTATDMSKDITTGWADPANLGRAFVWLSNQEPTQYNGLSFSAGSLVDTIDSEGWDFEFTPEKVTPRTEDMIARLQWQNQQNKAGI